MAKNSNEYDRNYYRDVKRPKTAASKAVAAATCQICGDDWANTQAGWNDAIFACNNCAGKLANWDREKEDRKGGKWATPCARSAVHRARSWRR